MNRNEMYNKIIGDMRQTYLNKNKDYGNSFSNSIEKYGLISALTRISDKFNRLENIILNDGNLCVESETIIDTLIDMANYCIMTSIELKLKEEMYLNDVNNFF